MKCLWEHNWWSWAWELIWWPLPFPPSASWGFCCMLPFFPWRVALLLKEERVQRATMSNPLITMFISLLSCHQVLAAPLPKVFSHSYSLIRGYDAINNYMVPTDSLFHYLKHWFIDYSTIWSTDSLWILYKQVPTELH